MGRTLIIRNVPEETHRVLTTRAAASGMSLQEFLLAEVNRLASTPTVEDVVAGARARIDRTGGAASSDIVDAVRADRGR